MKTAGEEDPNSHVRLHTEPSPWDGKSEPSSLIHTGWKVRKYPAAAGVFFLTFPFIELIGTWLAIYVRCQWEPSVERFRPSAIVHTVNLDIRPLRFPPT